jgi:hypothetical protein
VELKTPWASSRLEKVMLMTSYWDNSCSMPISRLGWTSRLPGSAGIGGESSPKISENLHKEILYGGYLAL